MKEAKTPLEKIIRRFLESKRLDRGAADATISSYLADLTQFIATLPSTTKLEDIRATHLDKHIRALSKDSNKASSVARKVSAFRQFFKFCCLELELPENPAENLVTPKQERSLPKALSQEQILSLLKTADAGLPHGTAHPEALQARDRAMVYLMYASGLRVSELTQLRSGDVDLKEGYLRVTGKGGKSRIAPFAPIAGEMLARYLQASRPLLKPKEDYLFLNQGGKGLSRVSFWKTLKDLAQAAGLPAKTSPHTLRHSFATHLLQSGINLRSLQMLLGHSDLSTTQIYTKVTPEHLKETHRKYHPRG